MKKIKQICVRITLLLSLASSSLLGVGNDINYLNPFEPVFNVADNIIYGDYVSIASSVECVDDGNDACDDSYDGYLFDATTIYKNSVDTNTIPLNSSTETLTLPADIDGKDILFAGLYWQGNITGDDAGNYNTPFDNDNKNGGIIDRDKISMIDSNGTKHALIADKVWYHDFWGNGTGSNGGHRSFYQAYKDVTTIIQDSYTLGNTNSYTIGNIKASAGKDYPTYFWADDSASFNGVRIGFWGNWQLIVVYNHSNIAILNPKPKPKNIAIFHGFQPLIPLIPNSDKSIEIDVSGFLTPKQAPVNAKMLFYGSGGEKKLKYDLLEIQDKKTTNFTTISNTTNPANGAFNGSISSFGVAIDPNISYYPGTDSDEFNVSNAMDTTQSTTILRLSAKNIGGTGDQFFPGLIAFSTDVYEPSFCYDYAYKQLNRFFTEDNDGSQNPRIVGNVASQEPITVSIYLKNLVDSDVLVKDMNLTIQEINTTQAKYVRDSTYLALNSSFKSSLLDSNIIANGGSVSDSSINGIPIGTLNTNDYFYTYYDLNTNAGIQDVNMSLNVNASYTLQTATASIPYSLQLSSDIPMCTTSSYQYSADKGNFNIVHANYYDYETATPTKRFYNLPTQITNRVGNFKIISIDENDTLTTRSAIVAVETIDAAAFHSALVSCQELASSISPRVWMIFNTAQAVSFDKTALANAYSNGRTNLNPPSQLYENARENAAFRSSYPLDSQGNLQLLEHDSNTNTWKIKSFDYDQTQSCANGISTIGGVCGSDGAGNSSSLNEAQLGSCMECVYGISTQLSCSRDNFAIRPDSFSFVFNDTNETLSPKQKLTDNLTAVEPTLSLAAGYKYNIDINATNYLNSSASNGYTKLFNIFNTKDTMGYIWSPSSILSGCNDESNSTLSFRISNGDIDLNLPSFNQVGRYRLNITDRSWSTVDNDRVTMGHHIGSNATYPNGDPMFTFDADGSISLDCIPNDSTTQNESSIALNGCNISSSHNSSFGVVTSDIFTTFHPYDFNVTYITPSIGIDHNETITNDSFIYMSDLSQDENMSFHLNGKIIAQGYDDSNLTNFVNQCYAKDISIDINTSLIITPVAYQYKLNIFDNLNNSGNPTRIITNDFNNSTDIINLLAVDFNKTLQGATSMTLNLNYIRRKNIPVNPQSITFNNYSVECTTASECTFNANLLNNKTTQGTKDINATIKHYYGRTNAPRQRFIGATGTALIYYEAYCSTGTIGVCDKTLLADGVDSNTTNDPRWFINTKHFTATHGDLGTVKQRSASASNTGIVTVTAINDTNATLTYDETKGYPYKTTMDNNASTWLIYNKYNPTKSTNEFEVEFIGSGGSWSGKDSANSTVNSSSSIKTNRRSMW